MKKLFGLFSKDKKKDEKPTIVHQRLASKYQPTFQNYATDVQLYVCGSGETRPIGSHQTKIKVPIFDCIKFEDPMIASQIKDVRCCDSMGLHFIFMAIMHDNSIKLFGVGQNVNGELTMYDGSDAVYFKEIPTDNITNNGRNVITHVACGYTESAVVTDNSEIFVTGNLGNTREFKQVKLPFQSTIVELQASFYTMFLLTDAGEVYELSRGNDNVQVKHQASDVIRMEIGGYHYVLIFKSGEMETRTCNQNYHAGVQSVPIKIHGETIEQIKCGWWTTYLVTSSRKVFMARSNFTNFNEVPVHPEVGQIDKICVPIDDLLLLSDGRLFGKGDNAYRVLGVDGPCTDMKDINLIEQLSRTPGTKIIDIRHSYIASYLVLGKFAILDLLKVWRKEGFYDLDIKFG